MSRKGGTPENLTPFVKGVTQKIKGGRPKGSKSLTTILRNLLDKKITTKNPISGKQESLEVSKLINLALIRNAITSKASVQAISLIYDRIDGKLAQKLFGDLDVNVTVEELKKMSTEELEEIVKK